MKSTTKSNPNTNHIGAADKNKIKNNKGLDHQLHQNGVEKENSI